MLNFTRRKTSRKFEEVLFWTVLELMHVELDGPNWKEAGNPNVYKTSAFDKFLQFILRGSIFVEFCPDPVSWSKFIPMVV